MRSVQAMAQHTFETNFEGVGTRFWCGCRLQKFTASLKDCKLERYSVLPLSSSLSTTMDVPRSSLMLQRSSRTTQPTDDVKTPHTFSMFRTALKVLQSWNIICSAFQSLVFHLLLELSSQCRQQSVRIRVAVCSEHAHHVNPPGPHIQTLTKSYESLCSQCITVHVKAGAVPTGLNVKSRADEFGHTSTPDDESGSSPGDPWHLASIFLHANFNRGGGVHVTVNSTVLLTVRGLVFRKNVLRNTPMC